MAQIHTNLPPQDDCVAKREYLQFCEKQNQSLIKEIKPFHEDFYSSSETYPDVQNVVVTFEFDRNIPLKTLSAIYPFCQYRPQSFAALVVRTDVTVLLFQNGKVVMVGLTSDRHAVLQKMFICMLLTSVNVNARTKKVCVQNKVCNIKTNYKIDVRKMELENNIDTTFVPSVFPGLIHTYEVNEHRNIVVLIFNSGSIIIIGLKKDGEELHVWNSVKKFLEKYKQDDTPQHTDSTEFLSNTDSENNSKCLRGLSYRKALNDSSTCDPSISQNTTSNPAKQKQTLSKTNKASSYEVAFNKTLRDSIKTNVKNPRFNSFSKIITSNQGKQYLNEIAQQTLSKVIYPDFKKIIQTNKKKLYSLLFGSHHPSESSSNSFEQQSPPNSPEPSSLTEHSHINEKLAKLAQSRNRPIFDYILEAIFESMKRTKNLPQLDWFDEETTKSSDHQSHQYSVILEHTFDFVRHHKHQITQILLQLSEESLDNMKTDYLRNLVKRLQKAKIKEFSLGANKTVNFSHCINNITEFLKYHLNRENLFHYEFLERSDAETIIFQHWTTLVDQIGVMRFCKFLLLKHPSQNDLKRLFSNDPQPLPSNSEMEEFQNHVDQLEYSNNNYIPDSIQQQHQLSNLTQIYSLFFPLKLLVQKPSNSISEQFLTDYPRSDSVRFVGQEFNNDQTQTFSHSIENEEGDEEDVDMDDWLDGSE